MDQKHDWTSYMNTRAALRLVILRPMIHPLTSQHHAIIYNLLVAICYPPPNVKNWLRARDTGPVSIKSVVLVTSTSDKHLQYS